jgi:murein L,D-transpeptidase YafK
VQNKHLHDIVSQSSIPKNSALGMKTTLLLSVFLVAGNFFYNQPITVKKTIPIYHVTKAKRRASLPIAPVSIVIDKSDYELQVFDAQGWYATYPVVFGNSSLDDKKMEGDRLTPEGVFHIVSKRLHEKWNRFMALDYPTQESLEKFQERKRNGQIPQNARPGGGVGIHGTWPHDDFMIDRYNNWTNGCIALKNEDIQDMYNYIKIGTQVTIRK